MESNGVWGNNGLTSVGCGGVWGNSAATGGSIWGAGGSSKRPSGDVWSGMETDSKPEGSKWRNLPSEGPRNGSPGGNIGASAIPDGDVDHWGRGSRHGSTGSWGSASGSDPKEVSGWGSLDPSPVPNAGTESWGFRSGANGGQGENSMPGDRKLSGDTKPFLSGEKNSSSNYLPPENPPVESPDVQSVWNRRGSASDSSQGAECADATQPESANKSVLQISATGATSGAVGHVEDTALEQEPHLSGDALSREEIIRRAVNSQEGWGKMPVRQDTAWNIDDEPKKPILMLKLDELTAERNQRAVRDPGNRQSWGQGSELPGASVKSHPEGGMWGGSVSDSLALGNVGEAGGGSVAGAEFGGKSMNLPDKVLSETGWSLRPTGGKDAEWGPGLGVAPNMWDASDAARVNKAGSTESGSRAPSLTRSASASTWSSEESDWSRGDPKEKSGSIWNSDSTDPRNWKPGFKSTTPLPAENLFNVPPPSFGGSDFENLVGGLGNPSKQGVTVGGSSSSDGGKTQMRVRLLQQLLDLGFKKEDAQAALISNNLNMENTISKLLANRLRSSGMDSDGDQMAARRQFSGGKPVSDLSMLSRADLPPDVAACLVSLMQNTPSSAPPLGQMGSHLGGARGAPQYRSSGAGSVPPFSSNPLGMLSPNVPPAVQQKMLQPGLRADGNQTALQHQLLQQHLLQNVQSAIQANLIPPQLITAQSLTPTVLIKVQHMMEMYQTLQGLMSRYQLMVQENIALLQSRQRPQNLGEIELIMTTFKQQICAAQQQVLRELAILQPPQPASTVSGMDGLLKNFAGLQVKDDAVLAAAAAGLANPWKVGPPADDPSGFLNQMAAANPNLLQHSISMPGPKADRPWMQQSSASCWSRPSDLGRGGEEAEAFLGTSYSGGSGPSVANCGGSSLTGSEDGSASELQLEIAEFVPGKPWQGLSSKSAEDDPHLALGGGGGDVPGGGGKPGRAYSPSSGVLGSGSHPIPGSSGFSGMSKSALSNAGLGQKVSPWSPVDSSMSGDLWAKNQSVPPGIPYNSKMPYQQQQQQDPALNCSGIWSSNDQSSFKHLPSNSPSLPSNWLKLKNVSQVDMRMLEALCEQHGHIECFMPAPASDSVVVKYARLDDACKAQKLLGLCSPRVGHPLAAEFLNKFEVFQMLQQAPQANAQSRPHAGSAGPFQAPGLAKPGQNPNRWSAGSSGAQFGAGPGLGGDGGASPWGGEEHGLYMANNKLFQ